MENILLILNIIFAIIYYFSVNVHTKIHSAENNSGYYSQQALCLIARKAPVVESLRTTTELRFFRA